MVKTLQPVSWQAEEYIVRDHNFWWYVGLFVVAAGLSVLAVLFQGWTFLILIILSVVTILVYSLRPPRTINYQLDNKGLKEENKLHSYEDFRSFGILDYGIMIETFAIYLSFFRCTTSERIKILYIWVKLFHFVVCK